METQTDHEEGFRRQRRNLLAISMFIIIYRAIGLNFENLNFLGNQVKLNNSSFVSLFIFIIFLYYAWRYTSYLNGLRSNTGIRYFKSDYYLALEYILDDILAKKLAEIPNEENKPKSVKSLRFADSQSIHSVKSFFAKSPLILTLTPIDGPKSREERSGGALNPFTLSLAKVKALIKIAVDHHGFSEYVFPYLLSYLAVLELFHMGPVIPLSKFVLSLVY